MIKYHKIQNDILLEVNKDLKKLLLINTVNLYKVAGYSRETNHDFFISLRKILFEKYITTEVVRHWLTLFIGNPEIKFEEIIASADHFNSNILEIDVDVNDKIDLSNLRESQIIKFILTTAKKDTKNENKFEYFIINFINIDKEKEVIKPRIYNRKQIKKLKKQEDQVSKMSESDLFNVIFDYFIINKQRENL